MRHEIIQPEGWAKPIGYSNGITARGRIVQVGGQVGWDEQCHFRSDDFVDQVRQALLNVVRVLEVAGARPDHLIQMVWYFTDREAYKGCQREIGVVYREIIGRHFPPMAAVQVVALMEERAKVEIQCLAVVPDQTTSAFMRNSEEQKMTSTVRAVVTRKGEEDGRTGQSGGCVRISGVGSQHTPATKIWFGKVSNEPGYRSLPHHHGEAETGGYVLKGKGRIYFGEKYSEYLDMSEGDFVFVPPNWPHVEANMSTTEELVWLTTRTPDNIVVNLPDVDDVVLAGFKRA